MDPGWKKGILITAAGVAVWIALIVVLQVYG